MKKIPYQNVDKIDPLEFEGVDYRTVFDFVDLDEFRRIGEGIQSPEIRTRFLLLCLVVERLGDERDRWQQRWGDSVDVLNDLRPEMFRLVEQITKLEGELKGLPKPRKKRGKK